MNKSKNKYVGNALIAVSVGKLHNALNNACNARPLFVSEMLKIFFLISIRER